jgi:hypothetical protein
MLLSLRTSFAAFLCPASVSQDIAPLTLQLLHPPRKWLVPLPAEDEDGQPLLAESAAAAAAMDPAALALLAHGESCSAQWESGRGTKTCVETHIEQHRPPPPPPPNTHTPPPPPPQLPPPPPPTTTLSASPDPDENPYRYVLSLTMPVAPASSSVPPRTLHLGGGRLAYQLEDGSSLLPPPPPPVFDTAPTPATAPQQPTPAAKDASKPSGGRTSATVAAPAAAAPTSASGSTTPALIAAAAAAATAPAVVVSHSQCRWAVDWRDSTNATSFFVGRAGVAALSQRLGAGGALPLTLRRVLVEAVDDDDPIDSVYSIDAGRRLVDEDHSVRGGAVLALQVREAES